MPGWLFGSLRGYRPAWLRSDVLAGLTVWAVLVPESLAYATIAGVPPVVGLYAAVPALLLYAALGSSRHLVVGPMSATAALSAGTVATFAAGGSDRYVALTTVLAVVTGVLAVLAGLCRLGFLASFISEPVLKGFIVGLALTIIVGQLPKLFGVPKGEGDFFEQAWTLLTRLGESNGPTVVVGVLSLAVVLGLKRWLPILPGSLIAVLLGIAAVAVLDLEARGVAIVGQIESGLPALGLPAGTSGRDYLQLVGPAVGLLLVGFAEGLGAAKTYAARAGYDIDANRELLGMGAANLGSGLAGGMVVNGSLSKTAVNGGAGAKSQVSGLVVAALTIVTLLFLTGLFEQLPEATLAAVVIAAVVELVDIPALRRLYAGLDRPAGAHLRPHRRPGRLRRRGGGDARGPRLRHAARPGHRHRRVDAAAALPVVAAERGPPGRLDRSRWRRRRGLGRRRAGTRGCRPTPRSSSSGSRRGSSSPTPTTSRRASGPCASRPPGRSSSTR